MSGARVGERPRRDVRVAGRADILARMDGEGPYPGRDEPKGHDAREGHDDEPLRGWISPDDRLWRHPSELSSLAGSTAASRPSRRDRTTVLAVGAAGAAAIVLTMAAAFALSGAEPASTRPFAATMTSLTTISSGSASNGTLVAGSTGPTVAAMIAALRPSLVGVEPSDTDDTESTSPPTLTGVVLPGGKLVVTAASAVVGMHVVDVVTADGKHHRGMLAGSDDRSGVAVVSVADTLPAATFADDDAGAGDTVVAACLCGHGDDAATSAPLVSMGMVQVGGQPAQLADGTDLVDALEVSVPLSPSAWGAVLLDERGQVVGLLDGQPQSGGRDVRVFVPAPLAVAVANVLGGAGDLAHGWLGIVCSDPSGASAAGPVVTSVLSDGPAAGAGLRPGDVITAVDGHPVATIAELQARLYPLDPGSSVTLGLTRATRPTSVTVTLSPEPA